MTKPTLPALAALLLIWTLGAIAITAIYLIHRALTGQQTAASIVSAATIAPIFGEPVVEIEPPRVRRTRKPVRPTLADLLKAEAIA
jgi:cytochrome P450